jgi:4-carboxymuconolactone decarboxylase
MPRVPYADPNALPPETQDQVRHLPVLNISRMLAHTGAIVGPWTASVRLLLTDPDLPGALRELAILRVAHRLDCAYEREQHLGMARKEGVAEAALEAIATDDPDEAVIGSDGRAVVEVVDQLLTTGHVDDHAFAALHSILGDPGTVKMLLCIGSYTAAAFVLNATQVELDETARLSLD